MEIIIFVSIVFRSFYQRSVKNLLDFTLIKMYLK